jgi:hypothetical protein
MAKHPKRSIAVILHETQRALHMSQREFGPAVGASHRSAVRWMAGQAVPSEGQLRNLAQLLHSQDRTLAAEVADFIDETLVSLGLETEPPPFPASPPPAPPPPTVAAEDLVDVLVLAAVERTGAAPAPMRALLHAVFKRAREVGLTVEAAEKALLAGIAAGAKKEDAV